MEGLCFWCGKNGAIPCAGSCDGLISYCRGTQCRMIDFPMHSRYCDGVIQSPRNYLTLPRDIWMLFFTWILAGFQSKKTILNIRLLCKKSKIYVDQYEPFWVRFDVPVRRSFSLAMSVILYSAEKKQVGLMQQTNAKKKKISSVSRKITNRESRIVELENEKRKLERELVVDRHDLTHLKDQLSKMSDHIKETKRLRRI
jgi:hypothetical protein